MSDDRWKKLKVWKIADELARKVYLKTRNFPREELFGLASQIRRAALSIPTNIVEGYSRRSDRELTQFLNISFGSLAETKYLLYFSHSLNYLSDEDYKELEEGYDEFGKRFWTFFQRVKQPQ